jgi:hypothetical protein
MKNAPNPGDVSDEEARRAIREAYEARIRSAWDCLPKDATPLDRLNVLRPLWEEERQWFEFLDLTMLSEDLRGKHSRIGDRASDFFVKFTVNDAMFADAVKRPDSIHELHLRTTVDAMVETHILRRERARNFLTKVIGSAYLTDERYDTIWPETVR